MYSNQTIISISQSVSVGLRRNSLNGEWFSSIFSNINIMYYNCTVQCTWLYNTVHVRIVITYYHNHIDILSLINQSRSHVTVVKLKATKPRAEWRFRSLAIRPVNKTYLEQVALQFVNSTSILYAWINIFQVG